jgi:peptide methionine sulfoxide reductase MsrB
MLSIPTHTPLLTPDAVLKLASECGIVPGTIPYHVLFEGGTEMSYTGRFFESGERYNLKSNGIYVCAIGGLPLFRSEHKFVSGTGWPSFYDVYDHKNIIEKISSDYPGRTEICCAKTGLHIGHAFPDKPPPALERKFVEQGIIMEKYCFRRYCVNANALRFIPS